MATPTSRKQANKRLWALKNKENEISVKKESVREEKDKPDFQEWFKKLKKNPEKEDEK